MQLNNKIFLSILSFFFIANAAFAKAQIDEKSLVLQKFSVAIGLVILFSAILYGILYLYKKGFGKTSSKSSSSSVQKEAQLTAPTDINEAISIFLEKTKTNK